jgi:hypothetical protein
MLNTMFKAKCEIQANTCSCCMFKVLRRSFIGCLESTKLVIFTDGIFEKPFR